MAVQTKPSTKRVTGDMDLLNLQGALSDVNTERYAPRTETPASAPTQTLRTERPSIRNIRATKRMGTAYFD